MRGSRLSALGLACLLATAPALAAGGHATPPQHASAKQARLAAKARARAMLGFQHDLVSVLAPSADAMPLLGAALLARPLADQPSVDSFHVLIARAAQAPDAGPAVTWARLSDCDPKAETCPNAQALAKLTAQAPDNAAVWLLKLGQDMHDMRKQDALADLHRAANASVYDDYAGISLQALANAVATLPPPPATLDPTSKSGATGVMMTIAFGLAAAQPQPGLPGVAQFCKDESGKAAVKADCRKLGKVLEWGSSPLARSLGLHLRETLDSDPAVQQDARHAYRNLVWQVQNFARLATEAARNDPAEARHLLMLARTGGTQMSLMLAALRDAGIATEAPAGWQPQAAE